MCVFSLTSVIRISFQYERGCHAKQHRAPMCFVHNSELTLNHCSSLSRFKMTVPVRPAPGAYDRVGVCITTYQIHSLYSDPDFQS